MTEKPSKSEAFYFLEKLDAQQRALMQALLFVFPESVSQSFLVDGLEKVTLRTLSTLIAKTNTNLRELKTDYQIIENADYVSLTKEQPLVLNPHVWGVFSSVQRQLLISILADEHRETIEHSRLNELNYRLNLVMLGKVHRKNKTYYLEHDLTLDSETLLQSITAFQQHHLTHFKKRPTVDRESDQQQAD